jgi:hypothetical protein
MNNPDAMPILDLLIALDEAGCGDVFTDGNRIYILGEVQIPERLWPAWERMRPELIKRLHRPVTCGCSKCGGRPILGKPV